jgi:hypothetical protein
MLWAVSIQIAALESYSTLLPDSKPRKFGFTNASVCSLPSYEKKILKLRLENFNFNSDNFNVVWMETFKENQWRNFF